MSHKFTTKQIQFIQEAVRKDHDLPALQKALDQINQLSPEPVPAAAEVLADPPGFNGVTCDLCVGNARVLGCGKCGGSYDALDPALRRAREAKEEVVKKEGAAQKARWAQHYELQAKIERAEREARARVMQEFEAEFAHQVEEAVKPYEGEKEGA